MTEKRFEVTFNDSDFSLRDNETFEEFKLFDEKVCYDYIAYRWNALYEENERLKEFAQHNYSESKKIISNLQKENEQLKSEINMLKITIGRNEAYIKRITSNGKFSNTSMK